MEREHRKSSEYQSGYEKDFIRQDIVMQSGTLEELAPLFTSRGFRYGECHPFSEEQSTA